MVWSTDFADIPGNFLQIGRLDFNLLCVNYRIICALKYCDKNVLISGVE